MQGAAHVLTQDRIVDALRVRHLRADRRRLIRAGTPSDHRFQQSGVEVDFAVEHRTGIAAQFTPFFHAARPAFALRCAGFAVEISKDFSSGAMNAPRAPASTAMLQMVIRASTLRASMVEPQNSMA